MTPDPGRLWSMGDYSRVAEKLFPASEVAVNAAGIKRGQQVLDVAAGTGNSAMLAAERGATVTATDIAPRMIELGRARTAGLDVLWSEADAQDLPYPDNRFDAVLSVFGAVFAPDAPRTAAELLRVVKPGGGVALTSWIREGAQAAVMGHLATVGEVPPPAHDWGNPNVARALFLEAGARDVITERRVLDWRFESVAAWLDLMENGPGPLVAMRTELGEQWPTVREQIAGIIEEHTGAGGGSFAFDNPYLLILARR